MKPRKRQNDDELNFWQPATDMFSALMLVLLLVILLLALYLVNVPDHDGIDETGNVTATPSDAVGDGIGAAIKRPETNSGGNPDDNGDGGSEHGEDGGEQEYEGSGGEEKHDGGNGGGGGGSGTGPGTGPGEGLKSAVYVVMVDAETDRTIKEQGVQFELYGADNSLQVLNVYYPEKISFRSYETTEQGTFYFPEKLWQGEYIVHELTEPAGYDAAENQYFDLNDIYDWPEPFVVKVPLNPSRNIIRIQMNDAETAQPVEGGTFEVIAGEDIITQDGTLRYHEGQVVGTIACDEKGYGTSDELYLGKYIVREKDIPEYYVGQESDLDCSVEKKTEVEVPLNTLTSKLSRVTLNLKDELYNTRPIAGAVYQVTPDHGVSREVTTDASGQIILDQLDKNTTYTITQTETVDDYEPDTQEHTFSVAADGRISGQDELELDLTNRMIRVEIGASKNPLGRQSAGVDMQLFDASGNEIQAWTTSTAPVTFTNLKSGSYYIVMDGNTQKKYPLQVNDQAAVQSVLVGSGQYMRYILAGAGVFGVIMVLAVLLTGLFKKEKTKNKKAKKGDV